jgi:hypothetical protein
MSLLSRNLRDGPKAVQIHDKKLRTSDGERSTFEIPASFLPCDIEDRIQYIPSPTHSGSRIPSSAEMCSAIYSFSI